MGCRRGMTCRGGRRLRLCVRYGRLPLPEKKPRVRKGDLKPKEKEIFLDLVAKGRSIKSACAAIERDNGVLYAMRKRDPEFERQWAEAVETSVQALEERMQRHADEGWDEVMEEFDAEGNLKRRTVNHRWQPAPAIFMLKARKPDVYRDNATVQVTGADGGAVQVEGYAPPTLADIVRLAVELGVTNVIEGEAVEDDIAELEAGD